MSKANDLLKAATKAAKKANKKNKFNARKVEYDGHKFDSQAEYQRYLSLRDDQKDGKIIRLEVHPKFELVVNGVLIRTYTADFKYTIVRNGAAIRRVVEDVKSPPTAKLDTFRMVKKLMLAIYGIEVKVVLKKDVTIPSGIGKDGMVLR